MDVRAGEVNTLSRQSPFAFFLNIARIDAIFWLEILEFTAAVLMEPERDFGAGDPVLAPFDLDWPSPAGLTAGTDTHHVTLLTLDTHKQMAACVAFCVSMRKNLGGTLGRSPPSEFLLGVRRTPAYPLTLTTGYV